MLIKDKNIVLDKHNKFSSLKIKNNLSDEIKEDLLKVYNFTENLIEAIYCDLNGIKNKPICEICKSKKAKFKNSNNGYSKWCGGSCATKASVKRGKKSHLSDKKIREKIEKTNLEKYGVKNVNQSELIKAKTKLTCLKKYGVDHHLKSDKIKNKRVATNKKRYGVENVGQVPDIILKRIKTNKERYNVIHSWTDPDIRRKGLLTYIKNKITKINVSLNFDLELYSGNRVDYTWICHNCNTNFIDSIFRGPKCPKCYPKLNGISEIEKHIVDFIKINYNGKIIENDRKQISPFELDIYLPDINVAFEINGLYYHSELNGTNKFYHLNKMNMCNSVGIKLIHIFEDEINFHKEIVESKISSILKKNKRIFARTCNIIVLDPKMKNEFLEHNHIQGEDKSKIKLGLINNDELVAVMTFGKPRYNKKYEWELLRYASKINTNIIGGMSKLMSYFIKNYLPKSIISYSDNRWGRGESFNKLNFKFIKNSGPSYWYLEKYKFRHHRSNFMKHKICTNTTQKTEWEIMQSLGYDRIWDCGHSIWVWEK